MEIYYLKWSGTGRATRGGSAYTDKDRAERHVKLCNKKRGLVDRWLLGHCWVLGTLNLKEGPKNVEKI